MLVNYLNLDFWFEQIYLLLQVVYNFIIIGPQAVSAVATSIISSIFPLFVFVLLFILLYIYGALSITVLLALISLGFLLSFLLGILGLSYLFPLVFFGILSLVLYGSGALGIPAILSLALFGVLFYFLFMLVNIYIVLTLIFSGLLIYSWYQTLKLRKREEVVFLATFSVATDPREDRVEEWQDIMNHIDSENESQWKLALIDADKILENLLREHGYDGDGVGGRLKTAEMQGGVRSLQDAWGAHKIRNRIAHESGFVLTKRDARRAVELYKRVFEDLGFL